MDINQSTSDATEGLYFYESERGEVEIFKKFVTPHYRPCENPIAMAVGALLPTERSVIKVYNQEQFGISAEKTRVASTNINPFSMLGETSPRFKYDYSSCGLMGDARMSTPYIGALSKFEGFDRRFDMVYIRNPDLIESSEWDYIFTRALEWTAEDGGVVVTLIREGDVQRYNTLLDKLNSEFNIKPVFSGNTGVSLDERDSFSENHQHTIGIFKPSL